ncbi:hypothetical protein T484DRAFT_1765246 [Baffinella frigidus]|nr:hypothetical protein T484DRAFT_1765246 [Cryptophyta sp. CCMP2293]
MADLKEMLRAQGHKVAGNKAELVARLRAANAEKTPKVDAVKVDSKDVPEAGLSAPKAGPSKLAPEAGSM